MQFAFFLKCSLLFNTFYCLFCLETNSLQLRMNAKFSLVIIQVKAVICSVIVLETECAKNVSWFWLSPFQAWLSMAVVYSSPYHLDMAQSFQRLGLMAVFILLPAEGVKTHFLVLAIPLLGRETVEIS